MNQYDILGNYLPAFGRIVGQMQHDLFHAYTVDQHIPAWWCATCVASPCLSFAHEHPFCTRLMAASTPWLLYAAAVPRHRQGTRGDHRGSGMADADDSADSTACRRRRRAGRFLVAIT